MAWRRAYLYAFLRRMRFGMASSQETNRDAFPPGARVVLDEVAVMTRPVVKTKPASCLLLLMPRRGNPPR